MEEVKRMGRRMVGEDSAGADDAESCSAVVPNVGYTPHRGAV